MRKIREKLHGKSTSKELRVQSGGPKISERNRTQENSYDPHVALLESNREETLEQKKRLTLR